MSGATEKRVKVKCIPYGARFTDERGESLEVMSRRRVMRLIGSFIDMSDGYEIEVVFKVGEPVELQSLRPN